jgi:hypothetical protein
MLLDVVPVKPLALKEREMVSAMLYERLVKMTTPPTAVKFVVPFKLPPPALRAAVTAVLLSLLRKFPTDLQPESPVAAEKRHQRSRLPKAGFAWSDGWLRQDRW